MTTRTMTKTGDKETSSNRYGYRCGRDSQSDEHLKTDIDIYDEDEYIYIDIELS